MSRARQKSKGRRNSGTFAALPHSVFRSVGGRPPPTAVLSHSAFRLLVDLAMQFNGTNNGNLTAAHSVLRAYGWSSKGTLGAAIVELVATGFIEVTQRGGKRLPSLYALTWLPIHEGPAPTATPSRLWLNEHEHMRDPEFLRRMHSRKTKALPGIRTTQAGFRTIEPENIPENGLQRSGFGPVTAKMADSEVGIRTPLYKCTRQHARTDLTKPDSNTLCLGDAL